MAPAIGATCTRGGAKLHLGAAGQAVVQRIKSISNIFEVGSPFADYRYVEALGDGRGYTVTHFGLVTNELEMGWTIASHRRRVPASRLVRYLAALPPHDTGTDMEKLSGFAEAWALEIDAGPSLAMACDEVTDRLYLAPALEAARALGIASAAGKLIFYDTLLQHGGGDDPDSFSALIAHTVAATGRNVTEREFLTRFLDARRKVLLWPSNAATRETWRASATRAEALRNLLLHNPDLTPPIHVLSADVDMVVA
jgi:chitosanase